MGAALLWSDRLSATAGLGAARKMPLGHRQKDQPIPCFLSPKPPGLHGPQPREPALIGFFQ
jgi:hypothetical protein